jgi:hypothetical protein
MPVPSMPLLTLHAECSCIVLMAMPPSVRTIRDLRDLAQTKLAVVAVCQRCRHRHLLFPLDLAERLGTNFLVADLPPRLRCTECKALGMAAIHPSVRD